MSCVAHDKRFRSVFHNIINDLRNQTQMPITVLRTMPKQCCTCHTDDIETIETVIMKEDNQYMKLKELIERVNREKQTNPKLIVSANRFKNIIEENWSPLSVLAESIAVPSKQRSRSSSSDSSTSSSSSDTNDMEVSRPSVRSRGKQNPKTKKTPKPPKTIKTGTFVFLPYKGESKIGGSKSKSSLLDVAKQLQLKRFITNGGHIPQLEKEYDVHINMIRRKTSKQVTDALTNAINGFEQLKIHNKDQTVSLSKIREGEWALIRSKQPQNKTKTDNIDQAVDDLTNRWESCFNIVKRRADETHNSHGFARKRK